MSDINQTSKHVNSNSISKPKILEMFVAIETSRNQNIGTILRSSVAFGATAFIIVGGSTYI
jgi:tRNA G18 (ribose-2'-O)-methylase SpoU